MTEILKAMVATFERLMPKPWSTGTTMDYFQKMVQAVVGFRIEITRLEGKWKLNQNHPQERREKVIRVLEQSQNQDAREIARLMSEKPG